MEKIIAQGWGQKSSLRVENKHNLLDILNVSEHKHTSLNIFSSSKHKRIAIFKHRHLKSAQNLHTSSKENTKWYCVLPSTRTDNTFFYAVQQHRAQSLCEFRGLYIRHCSKFEPL